MCALCKPFVLRWILLWFTRFEVRTNNVKSYPRKVCDKFHIRSDGQMIHLIVHMRVSYYCYYRRFYKIACLCITLVQPHVSPWITIVFISDFGPPGFDRWKNKVTFKNNSLLFINFKQKWRYLVLFVIFWAIWKGSSLIKSLNSYETTKKNTKGIENTGRNINGHCNL